ncbi:MAG: hypothetical protein JW806_01030 [Sedimentisphaerales bacterium]|nr:hypothetical protein [Sedimentisphaerales bacterium]
MSKKCILFFTAIILSFCFTNQAKALPRYIHVTVEPNGQDLQAYVFGQFMFSGGVFFINPDNYTRFPVPPDANNIKVEELNLIDWIWSTETYQTLYLPEQSNWPMIQWDLHYFESTYPFTLTYRIEYDHTLIKRDDEYIFFYADESLELLPYDPNTYPNGLYSAESDSNLSCVINFPQGYYIEGVWSRDIPLQYQVNGNQLTFSVNYPQADRLSVSMKLICAYLLAGDLNDDCTVNGYDFVIMAEAWISDFTDLKDIADNWLIDCDVTPSDPACVPK